eukprot:10007984-Alexandrium_andersonii.AAC.1
MACGWPVSFGKGYQGPAYEGHFPERAPGFTSALALFGALRHNAKVAAARPKIVGVEDKDAFAFGRCHPVK